MSTPTVFVCGVTGTVGGAVARRLVDIGWNVNATTRDLSSPAAKALPSKINLTSGSWDDKTALESGIEGCQGIFINLFPTIADLSHELQQAKLILSIAKAAGVKHVIYSGNFDRSDAQQHYFDPNSIIAKGHASKQNIEVAIQHAGFDTYTILRPGHFMANFLLPKVHMFSGLLQTGIFTSALTLDTKMPMIDHEDIAKFAVAAFQDPVRFNKAEIQLASEFQTPEEMMQALSEATGQQKKAKYLTEDEIEAQKSSLFVQAQLYMRHMSKMIDIEDAKRWGIPMSSFKDFLQREKALVQETYHTASSSNSDQFRWFKDAGITTPTGKTSS